VVNLRQNLLDSTRDRGEYVTGSGSDHPDGAHDDRKNDRQHDRVFRDILTFLKLQNLPKSTQSANHS